MPILILALIFCVAIALSVGIILSIATRYRAGTARRQGRRWVATVNVWSTGFGAIFFLFTCALMTFWIHSAFPYAAAGMGIGALVGLLGLSLTRWEKNDAEVYYTPNRWLAVLVVFALAARLAYGWWKGAHAFDGQPHPWLTGSGTALSLAVAAGVIGYYFIYALGIRRRLLRHERSLGGERFFRQRR